MTVVVMVVAAAEAAEAAVVVEGAVVGNVGLLGRTNFELNALQYIID
jgi:hypothetical protein